MRNQQLKAQFLRNFGRDAQWIFSAPGRTELSGNHTDHQRGCVLAAAVDLDSRAAVSKNGDTASVSCPKAIPCAAWRCLWVSPMRSSSALRSP